MGVLTPVGEHSAGRSKTPMCTTKFIKMLLKLLFLEFMSLINNSSSYKVSEPTYKMPKTEHKQNQQGNKHSFVF